MNRVHKYQRYSGIHYLDYRFNGRRRRQAVGRDEGFAELQRRRFEEWLWEGKDPAIELRKLRAAERSKAITFRDFFPEFMDRHGALQSDKMQESYPNFRTRMSNVRLIS